MANPWDNAPNWHPKQMGQQDINNYMQGTLSEQKNATNDYVRRASIAGIPRGGMAVQGGWGNQAGMQQQAVNTLAAGAADRYNSAYGNVANYLNQQNSAGANAYGTRASLYAALMGQANQFNMQQQQQGWQTGERLGTQNYQAGQNRLANQLQWNSLMQQLQQQRYATDIGYMSNMASNILK